MDPLEYVPSIRNATDDCLRDQGAFSGIQEEFENKDLDWEPFVKLLWFSWAPNTVLFGPMWEILCPCRNKPYDCTEGAWMGRVGPQDPEHPGN